MNNGVSLYNKVRKTAINTFLTYLMVDITLSGFQIIVFVNKVGHSMRGISHVNTGGKGV